MLTALALAAALETLVAEDFESGTPAGWVARDLALLPSETPRVALGSDGDEALLFLGPEAYALFLGASTADKPIRLSLSFRLAPGGLLGASTSAWIQQQPGVVVADRGAGPFARAWYRDVDFDAGPTAEIDGSTFRRSSVSPDPVEIGAWSRLVLETYPNDDGLEPPYLAIRWKTWTLGEEPGDWDVATHLAYEAEPNGLLALRGDRCEIDNVVCEVIPPFESLPSRIDRVSHLLSYVDGALVERIAWLEPFQVPGTPSEPRIYEADGTRKWCVESEDGSRFVLVETKEPGGRTVLYREGRVVVAGTDVTDAYAASLR